MAGACVLRIPYNQGMVWVQVCLDLERIRYHMSRRPQDVAGRQSAAQHRVPAQKLEELASAVKLKFACSDWTAKDQERAE